MELSMTPLRQRMIEDMQVRNLARHTQRAYLEQISLFARHFGKSPEILGPADIRAYQIHLSQEKRLSASSILVAVAAIRFLYKVTLRRGWSVDEIIPTCRKPQKLPVVLSQDEVARFLDAVDSRKHRAILTICYAAGLRISEAVRLTPAAIDSQRMVICVEEGKGRKDRYVMLSPRLLEMLRTYWQAVHPKNLLFPGDIPDQPISTFAVQDACKKARRRHRQAGHPSLDAPCLCRPPARIRHGLAHHPAVAWPSQPEHHGPLSAPGDQQGVRHGEPVGRPTFIHFSATAPYASARLNTGPMASDTPEVADVFRRYGDAYRQQHGAALSTAQRRAMTAIELCRTAALGGHVEQCDSCTSASPIIPVAIGIARSASHSPARSGSLTARRNSSTPSISMLSSRCRRRSRSSPSRTSVSSTISCSAPRPRRSAPSPLTRPIWAPRSAS